MPKTVLHETEEQTTNATISLNPGKTCFSREELLECAKGRLFGPGNAQLPSPPLLMVDRITEINRDGGKARKGQIIAEFDILPELWFFPCHFHRDPVMPGCLGLDAMWQLVGFFIAWLGGKGRGRALGVGEVRFNGQVTPKNRLVTYHVDMTRIITRRVNVGVADASMWVDGREIYTAESIRVGLFQSSEDF